MKPKEKKQYKTIKEHNSPWELAKGITLLFVSFLNYCVGLMIFVKNALFAFGVISYIAWMVTMAIGIFAVSNWREDTTPKEVEINCKNCLDFIETSVFNKETKEFDEKQRCYYYDFDLTNFKPCKQHRLDRSNVKL